MLARAVGFEPTTDRLTADCSTTELHPNTPFDRQADCLVVWARGVNRHLAHLARCRWRGNLYKHLISAIWVGRNWGSGIGVERARSRERAGRPDAGVVELVDAPDSKSGSVRSVGSIPTARTTFFLATADVALRRDAEQPGCGSS